MYISYASEIIKCNDSLGSNVVKDLHISLSLLCSIQSHHFAVILFKNVHLSLPLLYLIQLLRLSLLFSEYTLHTLIASPNSMTSFGCDCLSKMYILHFNYFAKVKHVLWLLLSFACMYLSHFSYFAQFN
jgi:hypothetical protein